ncbi:MarR family transcriptional regulator [Lysinibacillus macroides]|uniref:MarR family transcriptional regulator n=1 Tax=Lysinibacillus macroides TaxID=33935 RepID=A0A0M9DKJ8_9BACI|nr:MarR family transcriptional regulator [Lysinibacillus macroides]KOY82503.1 MarR family transcriptional regulator [Lysinibacillus macroides]QPR66457.1 MarR family transcriptional regulator [Lysinibacillus macroides]
MENENLPEKINQTLEELWLLLETKERTYTNFQLNNQQYTLLTLIIRHPSSTPTELAEKMNITKSAISQQLVKLEMEGYIYRKQHSEDKRTFSVELGEKGWLYKKEMEKFMQQVSEKYYASLSPEELTNFLSALQKLTKVIDKL